MSARNLNLILNAETRKRQEHYTMVLMMTHNVTRETATDYLKAWRWNLTDASIECPQRGRHDHV